MDPQFWKQRWMDDRIGFHQEEINPYLKPYWPQSPDAQRILVPLCGKSLDLRFLATFGAVTGVELSDIAIADFFSEWRVAAESTEMDGVPCTSGRGVELIQGDFFALPTSLNGRFTHAFDRAAMIALPPQQHRLYIAQLARLLTADGSVLSVTIEYTQAEMLGPPFSISVNDMKSATRGYFHVEVLDSVDTWRPDSRLAEEGLTSLQTHIFRLSKAQ